jgi:phosphatidylinositol dimannoside acyltransferase
VIDLLKRNGSDLIQLFVVPFLIALLPWKVGFRVLKWMARRNPVGNGNVEQAWQVAKTYVPDQDAADWKWRFRLLQLLERVDTWLVLMRSSRWWKSHIRQTGSWPAEPGPCVLLTYHWGGGQWIWRQLHEHGFESHFLARRAEAADLGAGRVALWYGRVREYGLVRQGAGPVIFAGRSSERVLKTLGAGHCVVGMLDLPGSAGQATVQRPLLGGKIEIPFGLARLAFDAGVPVVLFSCAFDVESGDRSLTIVPLARATDPEAVATRYIEHLDRCLQLESAFWQLWSAAPLMLVPTAPDQGT